MDRVYGDIQSGNCYKVKLLLHHLDRRHQWISLDILQGETRTEDFLGKNPNGKIPVLELEDGRFLWESNAILNFLAAETEYLPADAFARAQVLQWQFFEQYSHEPYIAVARFIAKYLGMPSDRRAEYEAKREGGYKALQVMETQLRSSPFLVGETFTIADISLYAYTHVAAEGGFSLEEFPAVRGWLQQIAQHPKHVTMEQAEADGS